MGLATSNVHFVRTVLVKATYTNNAFGGYLQANLDHHNTVMKFSFYAAPQSFNLYQFFKIHTESILKIVRI